MTVNKLTSPISQNDLINKTNEIIDNLGGGGATDVQINGTSITSGGVANILTESAYNSSTNKIATMSDVPSITHLANKNLDNLSATGESHFLKNIAGGTNSLSILAYGNVNGDNATSIGVNSRALGNGSISLGTDSSNYAKNSIAIGYQANVASLCDSAIQLGYGTNSTAKSLNVGFYDSSTPTNYQLLDGTTGLIPDARISTNIQRTSTAVTHTANTAVGSSTKPIYISSTGAATASSSTVGGSSTPVYLNAGTITSTGLSIASSRFDGQWVLFSDQISLSTATSATTTDVTSTIKTNMGTAGTDSYKYELLIQAYCNYKSATAALSAITTNQTVYLTTVSSGTTLGRFFGIIPVYFDKVLKFQRTAAMDACTIYFCGYRRIGTNS